jgi:hypothetical protein
MIQKILCPDHEEKTPSCVVYEDGHSWCYGCGAYRPGSIDLKAKAKPKIPPEDIVQSLDYITSLGCRPYRGLNLPQNDSFAYIVWPNAPYFTRRRLSPGEQGKYKHPAGHEKPIFQAWHGAVRFTDDRDGIVIVEGELNALALAKAQPEWAVYSPGSANELANYNKYSPYYRNYANILIIADADKPGWQGAVALKREFAKAGRQARIDLWTEDALEIYDSEGGPEKLRKRLESLGVPCWVPPHENAVPSLRGVTGTSNVSAS